MPVGGLFVDGANLVVSLKGAGAPGVHRRIDYTAFPRVLGRVLAQDGKVVDFRYKRYYGAFRDARDIESRKTFRKVLENAGWVLHETQSKEYAVSGKRCPVCRQEWKGRDIVFQDKGVDVALALDAYNAVIDLGAKVLAVVTHDADFGPLFNRLQGSGARRVVVGWRSQLARELRENLSVEKVYLDDLMNDIEYHP